MIDHGIMKTYKKGCRCDLCRAANAFYQRDYQVRKKTGEIRKLTKQKGVSCAVSQKIE